jgi:hypothetical protein
MKPAHTIHYNIPPPPTQKKTTSKHISIILNPSLFLSEKNTDLQSFQKTQTQTHANFPPYIPDIFRPPIFDEIFVLKLVKTHVDGVVSQLRSGLEIVHHCENPPLSLSLKPLSRFNN